MIPLLLIKSSPVDGFLCLRCLNNRINLPDMIGLLASGAINCLVAKIGTKDIAISCRVHFHSKAGGRRPIAGPKGPPAWPKPSAGARWRGMLAPQSSSILENCRESLVKETGGTEGPTILVFTIKRGGKHYKYI